MLFPEDPAIIDEPCLYERMITIEVLPMSSKTLKYILKRILLALVTVWVVITVTFFVMHAVPGGPFMGEKAISAAAQASLEAKYGLDKPLFQQYLTYLKDIVTKFDFGPSLKQRGRMVIDIIADGLRTSVKLGVVAAALAALVGIPLGALAALRRNKLIDKIIMVLTTAFVSMPSFIMGSVRHKAGSPAGKRLHNAGSDSPGYYAVSLSDGVYHEAYTLVDAGRAGSGLYPHGQGKGRIRREDHIRPCIEKLTDPRHHLFRTHAGVHRYGLSGRGTDFCGSRDRARVCQQHYQPGLSDGDGNNHCSRGADCCDEPGQRHSV